MPYRCDLDGLFEVSKLCFLVYKFPPIQLQFRYFRNRRGVYLSKPRRSGVFKFRRFCLGGRFFSGGKSIPNRIFNTQGHFSNDNAFDHAKNRIASNRRMIHELIKSNNIERKKIRPLFFTV